MFEAITGASWDNEFFYVRLFTQVILNMQAKAIDQTHASVLCNSIRAGFRVYGD
jgi:hypothetical protein